MADRCPRPAAGSSTARRCSSAQRAKDDPEYQPWLTAFRQTLQELGWAEGRNIQIDIRWAANPSEIRRQAAELVALAPDVILAAGTNIVGELTQVTHTVPIVFPIIADPVAGGFVESTRS